MMMDRVHVEPGAVGGAVRIPSSKSIGHRAIICAGLTDGVSTIHNVTMSKDIEATIGAMKALGASIECGKEWRCGSSAFDQGLRRGTGLFPSIVMSRDRPFDL